MVTALYFLTGASLQAEMQCAAGKCGAGMKNDVKSDMKKEAKYVFKGNSTFEAIDIKANEYSCSLCNMHIKKLDYATEAVKSNGDTYFFDDMGCMIMWLEKHSDMLERLYVKTLDTHKWMEAQNAHYSRIAPSPMGYGFGAVEVPKEGLISFAEVKSNILSGKTLRNPSVKKALLGE
jgi:predicted lipase